MVFSAAVVPCCFLSFAQCSALRFDLHDCCGTTAARPCQCWYNSKRTPRASERMSNATESAAVFSCRTTFAVLRRSWAIAVCFLSISLSRFASSIFSRSPILAALCFRLRRSFKPASRAARERAQNPLGSRRMCDATWLRLVRDRCRK